MKKTLSLVMMLGMLMGALGMTAFAATADSVNVLVTISDANGNLVMTQEKITVDDIDGDGLLTIHDALYCAHEVGYEGGAAEGYASAQSEWGLSLTKLWGTANGGSYGYTVNNASATGLTDTLKNGDYLNAYVYTDLTAWSDQYCYFNAFSLSAKKGEEITLTLSASGYDADWNPVTLPVADAVITVNGEATSYKTDAEGKVTLKLNKTGNAVISATSQTLTLVPPVCTVNVTEADVPSTGDGTIFAIGAIVTAVLIGAVSLRANRKKEYEN